MAPTHNNELFEHLLLFLRNGDMFCVASEWCLSWVEWTGECRVAVRIVRAERVIGNYNLILSCNLTIIKLNKIEHKRVFKSREWERKSFPIGFIRSCTAWNFRKMSYWYVSMCECVCIFAIPFWKMWALYMLAKAHKLLLQHQDIRKHLQQNAYVSIYFPTFSVVYC